MDYRTFERAGALVHTVHANGVVEGWVEHYDGRVDELGPLDVAQLVDLSRSPYIEVGSRA